MLKTQNKRGQHLLLLMCPVSVLPFCSRRGKENQLMSEVRTVERNMIPHRESWGWWFETSSRPLWRHCNALWLSYANGDIDLGQQCLNNGLLPGGAKPLPEPMLIYHQWSSRTFMMVNSQGIHQSLKLPSKLLTKYRSNLPGTIELIGTWQGACLRCGQTSIINMKFY